MSVFEWLDTICVITACREFIFWYKTDPSNVTIQMSS